MTPTGQIQGFSALFDQAPCSTWWVRPPHCGGHWLEQELRKIFEKKGAHFRIAHLRPDTTPDAQHFVTRVGRLWNVREERPDDPPSDRLADMVHHVRNQGVTPLLFVSRFHTMAHWLDLALLGMMRDLEQDRELLSCIVAPLPPADLKRWFRSADVVFAQSDYGDGHDVYPAVIPQESEMEALYLSLGGDRATWPHIRALSGGIPALVQKAGSLAAAYTLGSDGGRSKQRHREELHTMLHGLCARFFNYLDEPGSTAVAEALANQFLQMGDDPALLLQHPWRAVLLNEHLEVPSQTLGEAAVEHVGTGKPRVREEYSWRCYKKGLYSQALAIYSQSESSTVTARTTASLAVLEVTARVMGKSTAVPYLDSNWTSVSSYAEKARKAVQLAGNTLANGDKLLRRLEQVCDLAPRIARFTSGGLGQSLLTRMKDPYDVRGACAWLAARFDAAVRVEGPTLKLLLLDSLPETLVRLWLSAALGSHEVPELPADSIEHWWCGRTPFCPPEPGKTIGDLDYTPMAMIAAVWGSVQFNDSGRLFRTPKELERCLRINEQLRNPVSHETVQAQAKDAKNFLSHCEFHLERFVATTKGYETLKEAIEALAPLPFPLFQRSGGMRTS